jgi:hypothetical protein
MQSFLVKPLVGLYAEFWLKLMWSFSRASMQSFKGALLLIEFYIELLVELLIKPLI